MTITQKQHEDMIPVGNRYRDGERNMTEHSNPYFKYVTHGLSYEHKEYGAFDILILYTEKSIQNLRVFCAGKVFVDDRRGRVYIMEMEDGEKVVPTYEIAQYDKKTKKFFIKKNKLSLKKFKEAYNRDGRPIAIGLSVVHGDRVYQYIEIGEEHCKEYIAVSRIDKATGKLTYEKAISLKLKDKDFLFSNVEYMVKDDYIKYYLTTPTPSSTGWLIARSGRTSRSLSRRQPSSRCFPWAASCSPRVG